MTGGGSAALRQAARPAAVDGATRDVSPARWLGDARPGADLAFAQRLPPSHR